MKVEKLEEYTGYLKQDPEYRLDVERVATILAILFAYQKGVQGKFLNATDLNTHNDYVEINLKQLPQPFHQTVAYVLSDIDYCYNQAEETLKDFYYFNKERN